MVNWKAVIIGFILTVIFTSILNQVIGSFGSYIGVITAGIIVGYMVNYNWMNGVSENRRFSEKQKSLIFGAIHGGLIGILGGIVAVIIVLIVGGGPYIVESFGVLLLVEIIADVILGAVGGAFGAMIA
ncbi:MULTISPECIES: DUF5518 domain-containing protein [Methanobacterium]|uniref:DUF5518 domain-containing protein n=1 Tax=Methanobacterium veterum TaxID=408577 RepID=A0A9E4ZWR2_9EURY|nr:MULTISPECIES: DUF5518 domain-containing protein [Methanobacterium]MCZ3365433.1 DUF5518 domain-containing protein [Methanobacterium veterum]MCZ3373184.1 DUF5518 domain-containing protein [Methanobacterium veterum]